MKYIIDADENQKFCEAKRVEQLNKKKYQENQSPIIEVD